MQQPIRQNESTQDCAWLSTYQSFNENWTQRNHFCSSVSADEQKCNEEIIKMKMKKVIKEMMRELNGISAEKGINRAEAAITLTSCRITAVVGKNTKYKTNECIFLNPL